MIRLLFLAYLLYSGWPCFIGYTQKSQKDLE